MGKIINGIKAYVTDWKNLAVHAIVGIILAYCMFFAPLVWWVRMIIVLLVIGLNTLRMKLTDKEE